MDCPHLERHSQLPRRARSEIHTDRRKPTSVRPSMIPRDRKSQVRKISRYELEREREGDQACGLRLLLPRPRPLPGT